MIKPPVSHEKKPPSHVAIIMDGNGRWSMQSKVATIQGHRAGAENVRHISEKAYALGVKYLTLYTFSTENWLRPKSWVEDLIGLLKYYLRSEIKALLNKNMRLDVIGDYSKFGPEVASLIDAAKEATSKCTGLTIILALNYGSRAEITKAAYTIAQEAKAGDLNIEDISEDTISRYLYTKNFPDPDLLIRTSGEKRISNFLLWQLAYAEFVFVDKLWPDFTPQDFEAAIETYYQRDRRYGAIISR